ncbi:MAG: hypothetical protein ACJ72L_04960 [Marmoricola sp.]
MSRINGYPLWYYLVGVLVIGATVGLCSTVTNAMGARGWLAAIAWFLSALLGFGLARRVNSRLFRLDDPA